ncbi:hypothetical protein CMO92_01955 [Candidatus Woesearchaeota archaeon]|nr:hypothetical protein [Candidatus Woesearchaeota archaeon]
MTKQPITTLKEAQALVKNFALRNNWKDTPNIDKFDHLHEELLEMSQHLRYKTEEQRIQIIQEKREEFKDGIGDLFFALCRLSNQLNIDIEEAFNTVKDEILEKYDHKQQENNLTKDQGL